MNLVVTVFRHHDGVDFCQIFFIKNCKLGVHKIGGVKNVNMSANFATSQLQRTSSPEGANQLVKFT